jgi:hypothetical protein
LVVWVIKSESNSFIPDNQPMSAYHHRLISHSSPPLSGGRGLKKFNLGSQYKYNRGDQTDTIGFLEET